MMIWRNEYVVLLLLLLLTSTTLLVVHSSVVCTSAPPDTEVRALQALYDSTQGEDYWAWQPTDTAGQVWNFTTSPNPCDNWQGVECRQANTALPCQVDSLVLDGYDLVGSIPRALSNLTGLTTLQLSNNPSLLGVIPNTIGDMSNLVSLQLYGNALTGIIPIELTNLIILKYLYLYDNILHGTIPMTIGNLVSLVELVLFDNFLTGSVPKELTTLVTLEYLDVYQNQLHGSIPDSIGDLVNLGYLSFSNNQLSGTIPSSITELTKLQYLDCYSNPLTGRVPESIGNMISLVGLELSLNLLTNTIPASIGGMQQLQYFYFFNNYFNGSIPETLYEINKLLEIDFDSNLLTGTISSSISQLTQLKYLDLYINMLSGSIPESIGNVTSLLEIDCDTNRLTGTIPNTMVNLKQLINAGIYNNLLHGSIPDSIGNMSHLEIWNSQDNFLTGTIPASLHQLLQTLNGFMTNGNLLHGIIPSFVGDFTLMRSLLLSDNEFTGSIPTSIDNLNAIRSFTVDNNQLTGSIPTRMNGLMNMTTFKCSNNYFLGNVSVPPTLTYVELANNQFSGDVNWIATLTDVISLIIAENFLTGTLPTSSLISGNLTFFQASENLLSGSITNLFDPLRQSLLQVVDLSDNSLTGPIPSSLFDFSNITFVILAQNCFTGTIPATICNSKNTLKVLVLDGLHAAIACETRLFPNIKAIHTLANTHVIYGSIPDCLFGEMPYLETLHLSGNSLSGSLPDSYTDLGRYLQQVALSHNELTGTIPTAFQQHGFYQLDLSFNQFTGELGTNFNVSGYLLMQQQVSKSNGSLSTTGLRLDNNRLSGNIPSSLIDLEYIDILKGNMFGCERDNRDATLPKHDNENYTYVCGSDGANTAMIVYVVIICFLLALLLGWLWYRRSSLLSGLFTLATWKDTSDSPQERHYQFVFFLEFLESLRSYVLVITATVVVVFIVTYGVLSMYYSTYLHKYAWTVSICYLSGWVPGVCLVVIMIAFLLFNARVTQLFVGTAEPNKTITNVGKEFINEWKSLALPMLYVLLNIVVVLVVNAFYVLIFISGITEPEQNILTIAMALFKEFWRWLIMNSLRWKSVEHVGNIWGRDSVTSGLLFVCLFNNILAPCVATAMVNGDCFYYALKAASAVQYTNEISYCSKYYMDFNTITNTLTGEVTYEYFHGACELYGNILISTSFIPSFSYSFECTSTLLTIFAPVWIYMFLFGGIIVPGCNLLAYLYHSSHLLRVSKLKLMPLGMVTWVSELVRTGGKLPHDTKWLASFDDRKQIVVLGNSLAIILCFGVLFPPIAVVGCIALVFQLQIHKILVLDIIESCKSVQAHRKRTISLDPSDVTIGVDDDEDNILCRTESSYSRFAHTFRHIIKSIVFYVSLIWGLFLWDIVGGELSVVKSMWTFLLMMTLGLLLRYQDLLIQLWTKRKHEDSFDAETVVDDNNGNNNSIVEMSSSKVVVDNPLRKN